MNHVLGIVGDDDFETNIVGLFVGKHVLENPVEAIRFGSGAIVGAYGEVHATISCLQVADLTKRWFIVRVCADENLIVAVQDRRGVLLNHARDYGVLMPKWNEDCDRLLRLRQEFGARRTILPCTGAKRGPARDDIYEQIIEATEKNPDGDRP